MTETTHVELDRICTEICDKLCHWPYVTEDQEDMDDRCGGCRIACDLANLAEKLEAKQIARPALNTLNDGFSERTIYGCPACRKQVRKNDVYCKCCGQRLKPAP